MNFIIYPLLFGIIFALFKTLDLWYSKKVTKTSTRDWRFNPHLIWILFIIGVIIGCIYVLIYK
ncbi:hypothetical protein CD110_08750 [Staphylococcus casei]|uniref:hypothetical protein n=1 Tax=Staphylococcus casei TaxID=201828 RepID=UPI000CD05996|nr:hypothetical protein [Staphylococcus casei]PNZ58810.1 hypothetical protein CD110_08750 [Staphylococcus casei]WJE86175.1 hypothetical protein QMO72_12395 [Staphylococcus casei]